MSEYTTKAAMRQLAARAATVVADKSRTAAQKNAELDKLEVELKKHSDELALYETSGRLMSGGSSLYGDSGDGGGSQFGAKSYGGPSLRPTPDQVKALHDAATSKQSLKVETKAALDLQGSIPATLTPGLIAFQTEPFRVASLFPNSPLKGPSVEYIRHVSSTGAATTVAAGGLKPEITLVTDTITATARKIAGHIGVNDESLLDFAATSQYISGELLRSIIRAENGQLLSGNGTPPNLQGILGVSGLLTRTQAVAPETPIDTLELALKDLRVGASFAQATGWVMHPNDWSAIRLLKDTQGRYLLGHPADGDAAMLWGVPVVVTTDCPAKTVLVGAFDIGGAVLFRQGVTLETSSSGTDWTSNISRFRAEERLALAIYRPSAFCRVTLL